MRPSSCELLAGFRPRDPMTRGEYLCSFLWIRGFGDKRGPLLTTCASRALPGVLAQAPIELTRSILSPICPPRAPHPPWRPEALQGGALSPVLPHVYETRRAHVIRPGGEKGTTKREAVWLDAQASTGREDTGGTGQRCDLLSLLLTALSTFPSRTARKAPVGP